MTLSELIEALQTLEVQFGGEIPVVLVYGEAETDLGKIRVNSQRATRRVEIGLETPLMVEA